MTTFDAWVAAPPPTYLDDEAFKFLDWKVGGRYVKTKADFVQRLNRLRTERDPRTNKLDRRSVWKRRWVGEIKPHTASGIAKGRAQLAANKQAEFRLLVTYRPLGPDTVEILAATDVDKYSTWYVIGTRRFEWKRRVPLDECPACLGHKVEGTVRDVVETLTPLAPKRSASYRGHDLLPKQVQAELDFLRELVNELAGGWSVGWPDRQRPRLPRNPASGR
jgi:hypothetical protein